MNRKCIFTERKRVVGPDNKFQTVETKIEAILIGWGVDYLEFETGGAPYTAGIIELPDGHVKLIRADDIQFVAEPVTTDTGCLSCKHSETPMSESPCIVCAVESSHHSKWEPKL